MVVGQPGKLVLACAGCEFESHPRRSLKKHVFSRKSFKGLENTCFFATYFYFFVNILFSENHFVYPTRTL